MGSNQYVGRVCASTGLLGLTLRAPVTEGRLGLGLGLCLMVGVGADFGIGVMVFWGENINVHIAFLYALHQFISAFQFESQKLVPL